MADLTQKTLDGDPLVELLEAWIEIHSTARIEPPRRTIEAFVKNWRESQDDGKIVGLVKLTGESADIHGRRILFARVIVESIETDKLIERLMLQRFKLEGKVRRIVGIERFATLYQCEGMTIGLATVIEL